MSDELNRCARHEKGSMAQAKEEKLLLDALAGPGGK